MTRKELALILVILALGIFLRFYLITQIPPGLYPDEAANGNNATEALKTGAFKVFYPENNGREGLFINIQAASIWLFGEHAWALRHGAARHRPHRQAVPGIAWPCDLPASRLACLRRRSA